MPTHKKAYLSDMTTKRQCISFSAFQR